MFFIQHITFLGSLGVCSIRTVLICCLNFFRFSPTIIIIIIILNLKYPTGKFFTQLNSNGVLLFLLYFFLSFVELFFYFIAHYFNILLSFKRSLNFFFVLLGKIMGKIRVKYVKNMKLTLLDTGKKI